MSFQPFKKAYTETIYIDGEPVDIRCDLVIDQVLPSNVSMDGVGDWYVDGNLIEEGAAVQIKTNLFHEVAEITRLYNFKDTDELVVENPKEQYHG